MEKKISIKDSLLEDNKKQYVISDRERDYFFEILIKFYAHQKFDKLVKENICLTLASFAGTRLEISYASFMEAIDDYYKKDFFNNNNSKIL